MSEQRLKILNMLTEGKITAEEADRLLHAVESQNKIDAGESKKRGFMPKCLVIKVNEIENGKEENVNIRIPVLLLKAGIKLNSFLPKNAKVDFSENTDGKGLDFDLSKLSASNIDEFIETIKGNPIEIKADDKHIQIYCE